MMGAFKSMPDVNHCLTRLRIRFNVSRIDDIGCTICVELFFNLFDGLCANALKAIVGFLFVAWAVSKLPSAVGTASVTHSVVVSVATATVGIGSFGWGTSEPTGTPGSSDDCIGLIALSESDSVGFSICGPPTGCIVSISLLALGSMGASICGAEYRFSSPFSPGSYRIP